MNGSLTIATLDPRTSSRSVLPGYQLSDNFSLTVYDAQPRDSSTSYQCTVTIDDPQIPGTNDVIYDQLGSVTVNVYSKSCLHRHVFTKLIVCGILWHDFLMMFLVMLQFHHILEFLQSGG